MNRKDEMFHDLLGTILWVLIIFYILTIWRLNTVEPTIVYIEIPQQIESIESVESPPIEIVMPEMEPRYGFTDDDIYLMAALLSGSKYVDGDGEYDIDYGNWDNDEQISLVLNVVMNRVRSPQFPNTVEEVIWAPGQFEPMKRWVNGLPEVSDISLSKVKAWCDTYDAYILECHTIPDNHLYFYGNGTINISRERWYN